MALWDECTTVGRHNDCHSTANCELLSCKQKAERGTGVGSRLWNLKSLPQSCISSSEATPPQPPQTIPPLGPKHWNVGDHGGALSFKPPHSGFLLLWLAYFISHSGSILKWGRIFSNRLSSSVAYCINSIFIYLFTSDEPYALLPLPLITVNDVAQNLNVQISL